MVLVVRVVKGGSIVGVCRNDPALTLIPFVRMWRCGSRKDALHRLPAWLVFYPAVAWGAAEIKARMRSRPEA